MRLCTAYFERVGEGAPTASLWGHADSEAAVYLDPYMAFFARSLADLAWAAIRREPGVGEFTDARWPAHLHINVAPEARGTGAADGLMSRWLDRLRKAGSPGCHLQTLAENTRAVRFFERMGFAEHGPAPLVPGLRHHGRRVHQRTMVWNADRTAEEAEAGARTSAKRR